MSNVYIINRVDVQSEREFCDVYSSAQKALEYVAGLLANKDFKIKRILNVKDGKEIYDVKPQVANNRMILKDESSGFVGKVGSNDGGIFILVYQEDEGDLKILSSEKGEEIIKFFALNQARVAIYEIFKVDVSNCILTKVSITVEDFEYNLIEEEN